MKSISERHPNKFGCPIKYKVAKATPARRAFAEALASWISREHPISIGCKRILALVCLALLATSAAAFDKVGTTAAQFLQIGVGARLTGLGGAGVAAAEGADALYWNPARLAQARQFALGAYYANWIADLRHQFIGLAVPISSSGTVGLFALTLGGDEFEQTTLTFQEGNGVMVEYRDMAVGAALAYQLTDRFSAGGTVKYIHQKLFAETASTYAVDLGTSLRTDLRGFSIGMAMTNLGGEMKLTGRDLLTSGPYETSTEYQMSEWPLPLTFQVGVAWRLWGKEEAFWKDRYHGALVVFDGQHLNEGMTRWRTGVEYNFMERLFLRMGKVFEHDTEDWSFGAGLRIPIADYVIQADFAYADMGDLEKVQRVSVALGGR